MGRRNPAPLVLLGIVLCAGAGCNRAGPVPGSGPVLVSAAASLSEALEEIAAGYEKDTGTAVTLNFGSSGSLARQIVAGAAVDLFISADESQMDRAAAAGRLRRGTRAALLSNGLVLVAAPHLAGVASPRDLLHPRVRRIALGEPDVVPAGLYARRYLEAEGLWEALAPKIVPTASVRATLAGDEAGEADAGFVYRTDARVARGARLAFTVPPDRAPLIVYPAAVVAGGNEAGAARFLAYLRSGPARAAFERHGFIPLPA